MLPPWIIDSRRKLHQFDKYVCDAFGLPRILKSLTDSRCDPEIKTFDVVNALFHAALFRLPSINALEGDLKEPDFQMQIGKRSNEGVKAFSADVVANVLDTLGVGGLRDGNEDIIWTAERNKAFRDECYGTLRCVALDGWEPFASYDRHCPHCLVRKVTRKNPKTGKAEEVNQYYHRYVVALLLGPTLDVVLDIEPVRNNEARREAGEDAQHEGELSAAYRLMGRIHDTYGNFIDALVFDALYANGPVMTRLDEYHWGGFISLKKEDCEPLKEALALWGGQPPCKRCHDNDKQEDIAFWEAEDIETLDTYRGKVRVIRADVAQKDGTRKTWCFAVVGKAAQRVGLRTALKIQRSRWHIEDTIFNQWVQHWNLAHVYRHTPNALLAILLLWALVFNLLQLFLYRRLRRKRRPHDPCDTIRHIVEVMLREIGANPEPIPWEVLADAATS